MPDDPHAVSVCLPLWSHNIAYEEHDPEVVDRLQAAYPRFCLHPAVRRLCDHMFSNGIGLPFVSHNAARRASAYVAFHGGTSAKIVSITGQLCAGVSVKQDEFPLLRQYWQHAGEIVSSRMAERMIDGLPVQFSETAARSTTRQRVADLHMTTPDNVFLFASGMAAIAAVWRAATRLAPGRPTCQFAFPYVDTLNIQQRFPGAAHEFLPAGTDADLQTLRNRISDWRFAAVFSETPTNPLLVTPDLQQLANLSRTHQSLLIVDDTLRACSGSSILPYCDAVTTSLTKYFSGYGNVLAGALTLNPELPHFSDLRSAVTGDFEETLSDADAEILERNSRDLDDRVSQSNRNTFLLVDRLKSHPAVESVFYPSSNESDKAGCGSLFSVVLRNPEQNTPPVFDALQICKGPNLGTNFTLCCPYTILAHYNELDFAERCGVSRWLLRFSVGMEPAEELWERIERALSLAE